MDKICEVFNLDPKTSWESIELHLDSIERYYAGIPESQWLKWVFESRSIYKMSPNTINSVQEEIKIGDRKIKRIYDILFEKNGVNSIIELRYKLHKEAAIEILRNGNIEEIGVELNEDNFHLLICKYVFKLAYYGSKRSASIKYFEQNLFNGINAEEVWRMYYKGGDNYLG